MNMHADEKSDGVTVPERPNKDGVPSAEVVEEGPRSRETAVRQPRSGRSAGVPRRMD